MLEFFAGYMLGSSGSCKKSKNRNPSASSFFTFIISLFAVTFLYHSLDNTMTKGIMNFFGMTDNLKRLDNSNKVGLTPFDSMSSVVWPHRDIFIVCVVIYIIFIQIKIFQSRRSQ